MDKAADEQWEGEREEVGWGILDPGGVVSVYHKTLGTNFSMLIQLALVSRQNRSPGSGGVGGYMEREGDRHSALVVCMYVPYSHPLLPSRTATRPYTSRVTVMYMLTVSNTTTLLSYT